MYSKNTKILDFVFNKYYNVFKKYKQRFFQGKYERITPPFIYEIFCEQIIISWLSHTCFEARERKKKS